MPQDPQSQIRKAERLLPSSSTGFWISAWNIVSKPFSFGDNEIDLDEPLVLYEKAAIALRNNNQAIEAGKAWERRAQIQTTYGNDLSAASISLQAAAKAYHKESPEDSVRCLQQAIQNYTSNGNYFRAGDLAKNLAQQFQVDLRDHKRAAEAYQSAAQWYENDQKQVMADGCWEKAGELVAIAGDYYKAIEIYETLIQNQVSGRSTRIKISGQMLIAGLCHFASNDFVAASRALDSYFNLDPNFATLHEGQFLVEVRYCVDSGDDARLEQSLALYKSKVGFAMPPWLYQIAIKTLENLRNQGEDFS